MLQHNQDLQAFLVLAAFVAAGVSFWPSRVARYFVRWTVAIIAALAFLLIASGLLFGIGMARGFGGHSTGADTALFVGGVLVCVYFAVSFLACLPLVPARHLRLLGLVLYFALFPIAALLVSVPPVNVPASFWLSSFSMLLGVGLCFALLWFRMYETRVTTYSGN